MTTPNISSIESFRDHLSIMDEKGKRKWMYPRFQKGKIFTRRSIVAYLLLAGLIIGPFIHVNNHPLFLFNVIERTFIVFGIPFFPQDFFLFALAMLTFIVFIILFTSVFGRWWCGWACPQTIFMEFVFRRIEYVIEGDSQQRRILDKKEWGWEKIWKKTLKHLLFFLIAFIISNIFLAWIIGVNELRLLITEPLSKHTASFLILIAFAVAFYAVFAFLREQVCIGVCPYGRLQGVLLDKDSMGVSYDFKRGEPRGKIGATSGDCIDCHLCVAVCPTGIDIRNGTQLECIHCNACIDACNTIMEKIDRPAGLIRIASYNQVESKQGFRITTRMVTYLALWILLFSTLAYLTFSRPEVQAVILRAPGQLFQKHDDGTITNLYTVSLVNKSFINHSIELKVSSPGYANLTMVGEPLAVEQAKTKEGTFFISLAGKEVESTKIKIKIDVLADGKKVNELVTTFIAPVYKHGTDLN